MVTSVASSSRPSRRLAPAAVWVSSPSWTPVRTRRRRDQHRAPPVHARAGGRPTADRHDQHGTATPGHRPGPGPGRPSPRRHRQQRGGRARRASGNLRSKPLLDDAARLLITLCYQRQVCSMNVLSDLLGGHRHLHRRHRPRPRPHLRRGPSASPLPKPSAHEAHDEWQVAERRYLSEGSMTKLTQTGDDDRRPKEVNRATAELVTTQRAARAPSLRFRTPSFPPLGGTPLGSLGSGAGRRSGSAAATCSASSLPIQASRPRGGCSRRPDALW
jgi:hypothetical protein